MSQRTGITLQIYALLFLILGGGLGALLGYRVGATSDGAGLSSLTTVPQTNDVGRSFNWLFFEIGVGAGLICCAVFLAVGVAVQGQPPRPSFEPPRPPGSGG